MAAGDSHGSFASGLFPSRQGLTNPPWVHPNSPWHCWGRKGHPNHLWVSRVSDSSLSASPHTGNCTEGGKPQIRADQLPSLSGEGDGRDEILLEQSK